MNSLDWLILALFFVISLVLNVIVSRRAGRSSTDFFLSGRNMPWWLLGTSMVATTFAAGTPNFVTNLVREYGVAGNWLWWCFLPTGMLTTFLYAKLWRRSGLFTDIEFYELRYSGKPASFLRGFRAVYLGLVFNVVGIASTTMAVIKIAGVMLGTTPMMTVIAAGILALACSMMGGLTGVLLTDFFMFLISMGGTIAAAVVLLYQPGSRRPLRAAGSRRRATTACLFPRIEQFGFGCHATGHTFCSAVVERLVSWRRTRRRRLHGSTDAGCEE